VGGTAQLMDAWALAFVVLGRHELAAQGEPITNPFFFHYRFSLTVALSVAYWRGWEARRGDDERDVLQVYRLHGGVRLAPRAYDFPVLVQGLPKEMQVGEY